MKIKAIVLLLTSFSSFAGLPTEIIETAGVMRCVPWGNMTSDFYDMSSCKTTEGILPIRDFFDKYKRNKADKIINIQYDGFQHLFHIYYGRDSHALIDDLN